LAESIADDDLLYRRLVPGYVKPDGSVSSKAFMTRNHPDDEISVHLARMITPAEALRVANRPTFGVGALVARDPRALGFNVTHAPTDVDPSHSLIAGSNTMLKCRALAAAMRVVLSPGSSAQ
jgi:hypothetical protein